VRVCKACGGAVSLECFCFVLSMRAELSDVVSFVSHKVCMACCVGLIS